MPKLKEIKVPFVRDLEMNGKAEVIQIKGWKYLKSYETIVAAIDPKGKGYALYEINTNTTWRHYNAFARMFLGEDFTGPKGYAKLTKAKGDNL